MLGEKRQAIKLCSIIIIYLKLCFRWEEIIISMIFLIFYT